MAKTSVLNIPEGNEEDYYKPLQTMDRFIIPRIKPKNKLLSRKRKKIIEDRTYLKICSQLWNELSNEQKQNWKEVDPYENANGFRAFVADQTIRIKQDIEGTATPNQYHQDLVGQIKVESPAEEIKLKQSHPHTYYVYQKIMGKKEMYEASKVEETLNLPLKIGISYKSNLTSTGDGSFIRFYATVRHLYQGQNLDYNLTINIPLSSNWNRTENTLNETDFEEEPKGQIISYNLYFHLYKVRGTLLFDNIEATHSGSNWARDPFCKEIERTFSRQFREILDHWEVITLPDGSSYQSIYPE